MKKIFTIFILLFAVVGGLSEIYAQDTWVKKTDFPGGERERVIAFSIGTKGYIGTGFDEEYTKDFWEYDYNMGTNELSNPLNISVFSNPTSGKLTIHKSLYKPLKLIL